MIENSVFFKAIEFIGKFLFLVVLVWVIGYRYFTRWWDKLTH